MVVHKDTQWPCPDWYHIPSQIEFITLFGILTNVFGLASNNTTAESYLKIPLAWYVTKSASKGNSWTYGRYRSATAYNTDSAYSLAVTTSSISSAYTDIRAAGYSIRPFKDESVTPDNSWTTLYTSGSLPSGAWIYRKSSLWVISVSADWINWITIMDKNLWATSVYNSWQTLTANNCWNFYQRWNNYWFPRGFSGVTTSSTKVDATAYWPWNYYSSSTFIKLNVFSWNNRATSDVPNLRWWVSQWETYDPDPPSPHIIPQRWHIATRHAGLDYSAMKWPCQDGYHIPSFTERNSFYENILSRRQFTDTESLGVKFHIPAVWCIRALDWVYHSDGIDGVAIQLRTSTKWCCIHGATAISGGNVTTWAWGRSIRAFKDTYVTPDGSRIRVYDWSSTATWAWIFYKAALWIISCNDWQHFRSMSDKNEWATAVYNYWDTMSQTNTWNFYQQWNNYWFYWSFSKSTTQVDASSYWPSTYSSSQFIWLNDERDSSWNQNLRWWVTWGVYYKLI